MSVANAPAFTGAKVTASEATLSGKPTEPDSTVFQDNSQVPGAQGGKEKASGFKSPNVPQERPL